MAKKKWAHTAVGRVEEYPGMKVCKGCGQNFGKTEGFYPCDRCGMVMCELCCEEHGLESETCRYQSDRLEKQERNNGIR